MQKVGRLGDKTNTSVPSTTASSDVFVNTKGALRKTDQFGSPALYLNQGVSNVFVNSLEIGVKGSLTNNPSIFLNEGSSDVFAGV